MSNIVLISGSNRKGNTEYILSTIQKQFLDSKLILLRKQNIGFCIGCLRCHHRPNCIVKDDMNSIIKQIKEANLIIFGVPNYFDNVSGLFKNFIDRLHPLYKSEELKNKKVIFIFVGGGKKKGTLIDLHQSVKGFVKYLQLNVKKEFVFQALHSNEAKESQEEIDIIMNYIQQIL
ncbi:MAG: NAD(P)H-dependent oxidoreductase [Bacilli bacterium]|jgi:multimeric flavodoxin WrbA|nr:NAD(P)H-dependent oxidoreductase [Bacilli bacterium]